MAGRDIIVIGASAGGGRTATQHAQELRKLIDALPVED
jgi:hypothetical protein